MDRENANVSLRPHAADPDLAQARRAQAAPEKWVGSNIPRVGAARFVSGGIEYAADLIPEGSLFISVLRSPHAHARISSVDVSAAAQSSGVVAVLTGQDIRACSQPMPTRVPRERFPGPIDTYALAADEVLYIGHPVAVVVSHSIADAEAACRLIDVQYALLDSVLSAAAALREGASATRVDWKTNIVAQDKIRQGDVDAAIAAADHVVRGEFSFGAATSAPMETRCYFAEWDAKGQKITLRGTMQQPHPTRWMIAEVMQLTESQVRVVASDMGGTFGLKMVGHPEEVLVAILSRQLNRTVAFVESREECFFANAREQTHRFEIAANSDGKIVAFRDHLVADIGAVAAVGGWLMAMVSPTVIPTVYDILNVAVDSQVVTTNKPPWQGVRGYGKETGNLVVERAVDLISEKLGMDPVEVRRINLLPKSAFPHRLPSGHNLDSGDYEGALEQLLEFFPRDDWERRKAAAASSTSRIGIGFAFELTPEGASFPGSMPSGFETSTVIVDPTGTIRVSTSVTSPGSGNETGIVQMVADVFGVDIKAVTVTQGDTDITPFGGGNTSSRSLMFGGAAAVLAARDIRARIETYLADLFSVPAGDLDFAQGNVSVRGDPEKSVSFAKAVHTIYTQAYSLAAGVELPLQTSKTYRASNVRHVPDEFGRISSYPSFPYSVHAAVVDIDAETGQVHVLDYAAVHDCGIVVNPGLVEGQFKGAIVMGIGAALWEELQYDEQGAVKTNRFKTYVLPRSLDLPRIKVGHRVTPSPFHPLGMKGAGESGFGGAMAAIANAVADALGDRADEMTRVPCRPDALLPLLGGTAT
jgi:carbon-monoxide dehydrogenase large subunit